MRLPLLILTAALTVNTPLVSAVPAKPVDGKAVADATFARGVPVPGWARPLADAPATQRDDPVVVRLNETQVRTAGVTAMLRNRVIQVNERSSLARIGQFAIGYLPKYQRLAVHKVAILRGAQVLDRTATVNIRMLDREQGLEQGVYGGARSAQMLMDDVRVGDALWVVYTIEGDNPVFGQTWASEFALEGEEPVELARLSVLHPRDKPLHWRQLGDFRTEAVKPEIETVGAQELLRFELRGIDAVEPESAVSADYFPVRVIQFSQYADWHGVAAWASGLFPPAAGSPELDKLVATFRKAGPPEAQAGAALQWVQDEIRYFSVSIGENSHRPAPPDTVLKRRFGDCKDKTYLLTSILNRLGIAARPVLVNAGARKVPGKVLPAPDWFDHAVVRLELDGKAYVVDPTRSGERGPVAARPAVLPRGVGLVVDAASTGLTPLPDERFDLPSMDIAEKIVVPAMDGPGELESSQTYRSLAANLAREHYAGMSEREMRNELLGPVEKQYPGATLQGKPVVVDDAAGNAYRVTAHYRLPKPVNGKDGFNAIEYDSKIVAGSLQVPGRVTRNFPLALTPAHRRYRLRIDWPADVRTTGVSSTEDVANPHFDLHEEYTMLGNRTDLLIDYTIKSSDVAAVDVPGLQAASKKLYPLMEASFRVPDAYLVQPEWRTWPLRHVAAVRNAVIDAERMRQLNPSTGVDGDRLREFCATTADAVDMRFVSPAANRLLKSTVADLEKYTNDRGVRRCLAMLDFAWGDYERALTYYEADGPLRDDDALVDELAWSRLLAGDAKGAMEASRRYVAARGRAGTLNAYDLASALALSARAGAPVPADLRVLADRYADGPWPRPVLAYQLGALDETALLALAGREGTDRRDRMRSDAWFYIAQQRYARGDAKGAVVALRWVEMHGIFGTPQLHRALGELWHANYGDQDYRNGQAAIEKGDADKALAHLERAAGRGHGAALGALGHLYKNGTGVTKDKARAIGLFRQAAAAGDANAMNTLGTMFGEGDGVARDQAAAVEWFRKAAAIGEYYGSRNMGWRHRRGTNVARDGALAQQFLTDAAELGNGEAQGELADIYLNGEDVPVDYTLAAYWAQRAIETGDAHGKAIAAYLYANGRGVKADLARAIKLWQDAAKDGDTMARFQLGQAYAKGRGVDKDLRRARAYYASAALDGNLYAQVYLSDLEIRNDPDAADVKRIVGVLTALANQGMTEAATLLSGYYADGIGVPRDRAAAARWAQVAAGKGDAIEVGQASR